MSKLVKVIITGQRGQTGLRKDGSEIMLDERLAKDWVYRGWAKFEEKEKPKRVYADNEKNRELGRVGEEY